MHTLLDFKTGKRIYDEALYQVAAYRQLLEEHKYPVQEVRVVRLGKTEDEGFEEKIVKETNLYFDMFCHCRCIYTLQGEIRRSNKPAKG